MITDDFMGWRQADTQAMARHFLEGPFDLLHPRIDWGGDGSGHVETELALYPALSALVMRVVGETLWAGQLLSLLAVAGAALVLHNGLERRFGALPALAGMLSFLSVRGIVAIGTSIQPDSLALLAFTVGFFAFLRGQLAVWIVATIVAGLVKPTMLELGLVQLVLCKDLRNPKIWAGWAITLVVVGAYLLHARGVYLESGNTFGILSGGDSKLPTLAKLFEPRRWLDLVRFSVVWGTGFLAVPAAIFLLVRKKIEREEVALAVGALALGLVAFRYTTGKFGLHYHVPSAVLGAWLVAHACQQLHPKQVLAAIATLGLLVVHSVRLVRTHDTELETAVGTMLAKHAAPGALVVVRARAERFNEEWKTRNNFEDPRVFYLSRTHGWVLSNDERGSERIANFKSRGATHYAHVEQYPIDPALADWLAANAVVVARSEAGAIYAFVK